MGDRTYAEGRDRLTALLARLAELAERRNGHGVAEACRALSNKLAEERFNVVVVGEFKRGKTTFVNALLGAEVLPSAVVPLTSVVTAVTWGDEVRAEVVRTGGRVEPIGVDELAAFVTERGNPENRRGVERAVLHYPAEELRDGVFLVDTPGVGSVYAHNTEAARAFVPEADAAIFLTTADPPISDAERAFLREVREEAARMFFVLNKVDYLSESDREEAIEFTRGVIADAVGHEVRLYPVSARNALRAKLEADPTALEDSGLPAFERDFRAFLLREKGGTILESVAERARRLIADLRNSIDVEERAAALPQEDLARRVEEMERVFARAAERQDDVRALVRKERDRLVATIEADLEALRRREEDQLRRVAREFLDRAEEVRTMGSELDELVRARLRADVDRWRGAEDRRVAEAFRKATARFVQEAEQIAEETVRVCGDILGIRLETGVARVELSRRTEFSYSFFEVPTILESLLPDLRRYLPRKVARKLVERDVMEAIPRLVDKHMGRLRYDFVTRLDQSVRALERELVDRLSSTVESLRAGVRRAQEERERSAEHAEEVVAAGRALRAGLEDLDRELGAVVGPLT